MICQVCKTKQATELHHLLPQYQLYKRLYYDYIHHPENLIRVCYDCHHNKAIPKWTEIQFCKHFNIKPRTKSGKQLWEKLYSLD